MIRLPTAALLPQPVILRCKILCMRILIAVLLVACMSCTNNPTTSKKGPATSRLSTTSTQKLLGLTVKYYGVKNALVATDAAKAASEARVLSSEAASTAEALKADGNSFGALKPYLDTINTYCAAISANDNSAERQRISFEYVSRAMFMLLKSAEVKNAGIYKQYCPMAFNDKGAYWLSDEAEIKNPYFGKMMLECGEVQDSL